MKKLSAPRYLIILAFIIAALLVVFFNGGIVEKSDVQNLKEIPEGVLALCRDSEGRLAGFGEEWDDTTAVQSALPRTIIRSACKITGRNTKWIVICESAVRKAPYILVQAKMLDGTSVENVFESPLWNLKHACE
ncbi:hypothetical protein [Bdellovibrio bacteriovorus]|uniref:hypothetical protein n=1 Tax=Bdellovibrio bacteriovorus TaxID=959 RepID=UPI0035A59754